MQEKLRISLEIGMGYNVERKFKDRGLVMKDFPVHALLACASEHPSFDARAVPGSWVWRTA